MKLSLSVRIAEGFLSKEEAVLDLHQVVQLARSAGFDAVCMRASQVGVHSSHEDIDVAMQILRRADMPVSMVTGDFDIVYNNDDGPNCLRNITPYLQLASQLGTPRIRVALKVEDDIHWAREAAQQAEDLGIMVLHQCHTRSLFETLDAIEGTLEKIDHPNFGLIYEPANLEICGEDYGPDSIQRLRPWIKNVYLQNQVLRPDGAVTLDTWCRGPVSFDLIQIHEPGGVDFRRVLQGLKDIKYDDTITVHQSAPVNGSPLDAAAPTADLLRDILAD